jgi:Tfp pilus assembly protein PilO
VSDGRHMSSPRDPLAIFIAAVGLLAQVGVWIWWGGKMDQRVSTIEANQEKAERRADEKVSVDAVQTVQIEVLKTDLGYIKASVDKIDRKIPERR